MEMSNWDTIKILKIHIIFIFCYKMSDNKCNYWGKNYFIFEKKKYLKKFNSWIPFWSLMSLICWTLLCIFFTLNSCDLYIFIQIFAKDLFPYYGECILICIISIMCKTTNLNDYANICKWNIPQTND